MSQYVRLTRGVKDRGILVKPEDLYSHIDNANEDWYSSIYYYTDAHLKTFKEKGTIAGITDVKTDKLVFDFDSKDNIEQARLDTLELIKRLSIFKIKPTSLELFFSGNKGFTVVLPLDRMISPREAKLIAIEKLGTGLKTLDPSIYNASRILRIPMTLHQSSHLYKIPLTFSDLNSLKVEQIQTKAKSLDNVPDEYIVEPITEISEKLYEVSIPERKAPEAPIVDISSIDFSKKPPYLDKSRWLLMKGFFKDGQRSNALLCLASTLKNVGYDQEVVYRMLKGVAELQSKRHAMERFDDVELYNNIILQVYGPYWKGGQYTTKDPTSWLYNYAKEMGVLEDDTKTLVTIGDIENGFIDYVKNIDKNTIKTGITSLDAKLPLTIGMTVGIVGAPSSGKTSLALDILKNTSQNGVLSVFASLDMHRNRVFEKLLYKVTGGMDRKELYEAYQEGKGEELTAKVKEQYGNVWFYDRSGATVENIRDYIKDVENKTGEKVKMVMLDYFERVLSDMSDDTAASKRIAGEIQDLVNDLNVCMVVLVQPNKMSIGSGPDQPILSYTAIKGSSFIAQAFRSIVSIWRPFQNPDWKRHDNYMQMAILKNDLGELDTFDFHWVGKTGEIRELEEFERLDLERMLEEKNRKKDKGDEW